MNQSIDTLASSSGATNLLEAAVRHEAKEIKDQLGEMNQSIDTLASSSAKNQLSRGMFFSFTMAVQLFCYSVYGRKYALVSISDRSSLFPAHELEQLVEKEIFFITLRIIWKRAAYTVLLS